MVAVVAHAVTRLAVVFRQGNLFHRAIGPFPKIRQLIVRGCVVSRRVVGRFATDARRAGAPVFVHTHQPEWVDVVDRQIRPCAHQTLFAGGNQAGFFLISVTSRTALGVKAGREQRRVQGGCQSGVGHLIRNSGFVDGIRVKNFHAQNLVRVIGRDTNLETIGVQTGKIGWV